METNEQKSLTFNGVNIIKVEFESLKFSTDEMLIELNTDAKLCLDSEFPNVFNIIMEVDLKAENYFNLKVIAIGEFIFDSEIDESLKTNFININAPAIMFPYVRAFISTFTVNCGKSIQPLNIPTQFFSGTLEQLDNYKSN